MLFGSHGNSNACSTCRGWRTIKVVTELDGEYSAVREIICLSCKGTGRIASAIDAYEAELKQQQYRQG